MLEERVEDGAVALRLPTPEETGEEGQREDGGGLRSGSDLEGADMPEGEEQRLERQGQADVAAREVIEGDEQRRAEVKLLREGTGWGIDKVIERAEGLGASDEQRARDEDEEQRQDESPLPRWQAEAQAELARRDAGQQEDDEGEQGDCHAEGVGQRGAREDGIEQDVGRGEADDDPGGDGEWRLEGA